MRNVIGRLRISIVLIEISIKIHSFFYVAHSVDSFKKETII